jgi:predicted MFS family arabinose efflux permease
VDTILAIEMFSRYKTSNEMIGMIFLFASVAYILGAPLSSYLANKMNRRYIIFYAYILIIISNLLCGPSKLMNLPAYESLVIMGVIL